MGEYIPIVTPLGNVEKFLSVGSDFFTILDRTGKSRFYFWVSFDKAYSIDELVDSNYYIHFDSHAIYLLNYLEILFRSCLLLRLIKEKKRSIRVVGEG